jgi:hypothetical protein
MKECEFLKAVKKISESLPSTYLNEKFVKFNLLQCSLFYEVGFNEILDEKVIYLADIKRIERRVAKLSENLTLEPNPLEDTFKPIACYGGKYTCPDFNMHYWIGWSNVDLCYPEVFAYRINRKRVKNERT